MNILELEDVVKGLPDDALIQQAQNPSGELPQYLTISEIQRRSDMRERFQAQQEQPQGTIADQVIQKGIASIQPQGYAQGGDVRRWWQMINPMGNPQAVVGQSQQPGMGRQMGGVADIRMQIADIQSQGLTPDLDERGQPVVSWEGGKPRVVVNGRPYGYAQGGIVSMQSGGSVPEAMLSANPFFGYPAGQAQQIMRMLSGQRGPIVEAGMQVPERGYNENPGLAFLQRNPLLGGFVEPLVGMYGEATDPYQSPGIEKTVESGIQSGGITSLAPEEFVGPPEPHGSANIQGSSPIQQQSLGLDMFGAMPPMPGPREPIEYPSFEGQREGLAALGAERRGMYEDLAEQQRGSSIDVSDLIKEGKDDAWSAAMVQIGAGIARNDLAGGLEQAGQTGADAAKQARAMELWSRIQNAENDAKARELLAKGVISEQEYKQAILQSEVDEKTGRAKFDFEQRQADSDDLYKRGAAHVNSLKAKLTELEILEKLSSMAASGEADIPEPPEGKTMYELMGVATGLGASIQNAVGQFIDLAGGDLPAEAKAVVEARADMRANLERLYGALADTRAWREREWIRDKYDIDPKATLGDDTGRTRLEGLAGALKTMLQQEESDAQNPALDGKEREKAAHNARVIRNFIPIIGAPEASAEDFLSQ